MIKQYSEELVSKYSVFRPLEFRSIQCYEALLIHFIDVGPSLLENHNHSIVQNITSLCWSSISKYAAFSTPIFWGVRAVGGLCSSLFLNFSSHWKWKKKTLEREKNGFLLHIIVIWFQKTTPLCVLVLYDAYYILEGVNKEFLINSVTRLWQEPPTMRKAKTGGLMALFHKWHLVATWTMLLLGYFWKEACFGGFFEDNNDLILLLANLCSSRFWLKKSPFENLGMTLKGLGFRKDF